MANCDICYQQDAPIMKTLYTYTALQEQVKIKTGYKMYQTRFRTIAPRQHTYHICEKCVNKSGTKGIIVWAVATVLSIFIIVVALNLANATNDGGPFGLAVLTVPILTSAFYLNKNTLSLQSRINKMGIKERKRPMAVLLEYFNGDSDPRFAGEDKQVFIVALSRSGFLELTKKIAENH